MTPAQWRQIWLSIEIALSINIGLAFIPSFVWVVWVLQLFYLIPATVVLLIMRRSYIVGALWLVGGATFILDLAYCGYRAHM